jgi:hypothetical protein
VLPTKALVCALFSASNGLSRTPSTFDRAPAPILGNHPQQFLALTEAFRIQH